MAKQQYKSPIDLFKSSIEAVKRNLTLFIFLNVLTLLSVAWRIGSDVRHQVHGSGWDSVFLAILFLVPIPKLVAA